MKDVIDTAKGRIVDYDPYSQEYVIRVPYTDYNTMIRRNYKTCIVQFEDSRTLSDKQRKACYALIHEIADFTGMGADTTKQYMKLKFLAEDLQETADKIFSLSNASMSLVCAFQKFLVRFIIDWEIPCSFPLLNYVDDVGDYVYACLNKKVCCICGESADLHHTDRIGMGRDRDIINHIGLMAEPLCRKHHTECHNIGQKAFDERYHLVPVKIDKPIAKIYGLNTKQKKQGAGKEDINEEVFSDE